jgi:hypothetical protein
MRGKEREEWEMKGHSLGLPTTLQISYIFCNLRLKGIVSHLWVTTSISTLLG